ncbi:MAG: AAA family ATPase [Clostridia bacterium]|nr:AAA family ATPase [Clostridia bacterium]
MTKIIAIANQKGGVGKTTTAVNLSACLAKLGKNVLLLDMDPQGNATSGLGVDNRTQQKSVYDVLIGNAPIKDVIIKTEYARLFLCPSNIALSGAEIELVNLMAREYRLKEAIETIKASYDFILLDCPPSLGLVTLNALTAADSVIMPIQCEYYALEGLSQLTATIRRVKKLLNPRIEIEGVLMTMFSARTNLAIQVVDEVKKFFPQKVYKTIIPRNVRLSEAPGFGQPVIVYDPSSRGADSYMELAKEVLEANEAAPEAI